VRRARGAGGAAPPSFENLGKGEHLAKRGKDPIRGLRSPWGFGAEATGIGGKQFARKGEFSKRNETGNAGMGENST